MSNDVNEVISIDIDSTGLIYSISSDISERNITDNETRLEKYIFVLNEKSVMLQNREKTFLSPIYVNKWNTL